MHVPRRRGSVENGMTPPPGMEGATQKQMELFQKQQAAAREQRARDQDRLLEVIAGASRSISYSLLDVGMQGFSVM